MLQRHNFIVSFALLLASFFVGFLVSEGLGSHFSSSSVPGLLGTGATLVLVDLAWRATSLRTLGLRALVSLDAGGRLKLLPLWWIGMAFLLMGVLSART